MAATYTPVTLDQMVELLTLDKGWHAVELPRVEEHVLDWRVKRFAAHIVVRVYTSVKKTSGHGRGCGRDAIRVCAVNLDTDRGLVKAKRVHRVENWRVNLRKRIESVIAELDGRGYALRSRSPAPAREPVVAAAETFKVGEMKPIPPNTSQRLRDKLRRANEAEAAQQREPNTAPPDDGPRVTAHEWDDAPAPVAGVFNEDGDLDIEAAEHHLCDDTQPTGGIERGELGVVIAPPTHPEPTMLKTAPVRRERRRPTLKAKYR